MIGLPPKKKKRNWNLPACRASLHASYISSLISLLSSAIVSPTKTKRSTAAWTALPTRPSARRDRSAFNGRSGADTSVVIYKQENQTKKMNFSWTICTVTCEHYIMCAKWTWIGIIYNSNNRGTNFKSRMCRTMKLTRHFLQNRRTETKAQQKNLINPITNYCVLFIFLS